MVRLPASLRLASDSLALRDHERVLVRLGTPLERTVFEKKLGDATGFALESDRGIGELVQHRPSHYWLRKDGGATAADLERLENQLASDNSELSAVFQLPDVPGRRG